MKHNLIMPLPSDDNSYYEYDKRRFDLPSNIYFVYGSNLLGRHGNGAALTAVQDFGAIEGVAEGPQGQSYAIPTRYRPYHTLPVVNIYQYVRNFKEYANSNPQLSFFVTAVGCGHAGLNAEIMAPMFRGLRKCWFPLDWKPYLES